MKQVGDEVLTRDIVRRHGTDVGLADILYLLSMGTWYRVGAVKGQMIFTGSSLTEEAMMWKMWGSKMHVEP